MLKKRFICLAFLFILAISVFVFAVVDKSNRWHSSTADIKLLIDSSEKTLQTAIDSGLLAGSHTYSVSSSSPAGGHNANKIWVSVSGVENNMIQALSSTGLCGSTPTISYNGPSDKSDAYHYATEIEVTVSGSPMSLQDAIDAGKFCSGWILINGDDSLGTSDFLVMQYESKNVGGNPTSQEAGTPWVSLSLSTAKSECASLGSGYHLLTNAEWMTIAKSIESSPSSWTGGAVGSGSIKRGNIGTIDAGSYAKGRADYGSNRNITAKSTLTNGAVIWDFVGNVQEWIDSTCTPGKTGTGFWYAQSVQWNNINLSDFERAEAGPSSSIDYGSTPLTKGAGSYLGCGMDNDYVDWSGRRYYYNFSIVRSGAYDSGSYGLFSLVEVKSTDYYRQNLGFRCAKTLCESGSCYSYNWVTSDWNIGSGTRTRTVSCIRNDGTIVGDSNCAGTKPPSSQIFFNGSGCSSCPNGYFQWGDAYHRYCNLNGKQGSFKTKAPQYDDWRPYSYSQYSAQCCCSHVCTTCGYEDTLWKMIE